MDEALEEIVFQLVKDRFPNAVIDNVEVRGATDSDGDPILWITVVFDTEIASLESGTLAGLTRHVRPKLLERSDKRFPIFRFLSKRDNDRLSHAAA